MEQIATLTKEAVILAKKNGVLDKIKGEHINRLIRKKYTASEELALLWASQNGEKADEVSAFIAYRDECKAAVTEIINAFLAE